MVSRRVSGVIACLMLVGCAATVRATAQTLTRPTNAQSVVSSFYTLLNGDLVSGDFANLATIYAPGAVLIQSTPAGVTKVYRGMKAILGFYKVLHANNPGLHFTLASERLLTSAIIVRYMRAATPSMTVPARCAHLFMVNNGLIASEDWVVYFGGK